jgi:hypothetical protein
MDAKLVCQTVGVALIMYFNTSIFRDAQQKNVNLEMAKQPQIWNGGSSILNILVVLRKFKDPESATFKHPSGIA